MGVEAKHRYRFGYLKSEHWHDLRTLKLIKSAARCAGCGRKNWGHDVHHVKYADLYSVQLGDLRVLCRECHTSVHFVMAGFPEHKQIFNSARRWEFIRKHVKLLRRAAQHHPLNEAIKLVRSRWENSLVNDCRSDFNEARKKLISNGTLTRNDELPWVPKLFDWQRLRRTIAPHRPIAAVEWFLAAGRFTGFKNLLQPGEH